MCGRLRRDCTLESAARSLRERAFPTVQLATTKKFCAGRQAQHVHDRDIPDCGSPRVCSLSHSLRLQSEDAEIYLADPAGNDLTLACATLILSALRFDLHIHLNLSM